MEANNIRIKKGLRIGDLDAETDRDLMNQCFVDNGDLQTLLDVSKPESIITGRTGAGKSALLLRTIETQENSILLDPNDISIRFLEHSDIIQFLEELGVKLDLFYRYLWRHIITIELLRLRYKFKSEEEGRGVFDKLFSFVGRDPVKESALNYFKDWNNKFWLEADQQLKEVTEKLSRTLAAGIKTNDIPLDFNLEGARNLEKEVKTEIRAKAQRVVSGIQIKKLAEVIQMLEEKVFLDDQKKYYLLIDKLDEDWAETSTRYKFIRALVEEIKIFRNIGNVKILVSMREDLLDSVFDRTRDAGFQEEKYESYILKLRWTEDDLFKMVEKRINTVFQHQYTKENVEFSDIFPKKTKDGQESFKYILERTLFRPRDILQFVNECFLVAIDRDRISWNSIRSAELNYSQKRLNSLFEEWKEPYPGLPQSINFLREITEIFSRSVLSTRLESGIGEMLDFEKDPCGQAVISFCDPGSKMSISDVTAIFLSCYFKIGAIGVKYSATEPYHWSAHTMVRLQKESANRIIKVKVHKMLHRALGVRPAGTIAEGFR